MSYVRKHLQEGEAIICEATVHWIVYLRAVIIGLLALATGLAASRFSGTDWTWILGGIFIVLAIAAAVSWFNAFVDRWATELAITDRRIIVKRGVIRRSTNEMNRSKVESVLVRQSIFGRLLDFGTIVVKGTGGGWEPLIHIREPLRFRNFLTAS